MFITIRSVLAEMLVRLQIGWLRYRGADVRCGYSRTAPFIRLLELTARAEHDIGRGGHPALTRSAVQDLSKKKGTPL